MPVMGKEDISEEDIKTEINLELTLRTAVPERSLIRVPDSNHNIRDAGSSTNQNGRKRKQPVSSSGSSPSAAPSVNTAGFSFYEVYSVHASTGKVICCDFSSDGRILASAGHDKKAVLWHTDTMKPKTTLEEHTALITDVRFSPSLPRLATSSFDKTVKKGYSLRTFVGHSSMVTSLDFHPKKDDLICSCDNDGEIRYWSINNGSCTRVYKGSSTQMSFQPRDRMYLAASAAQVRFQPRAGKYLAASSANVVSILDVETQACRYSLQGHSTPINSVCWDPSGDFLASVSKDKVKVWTLGTGSEGECVHELSFNGSNFLSCVFHPAYPSLLVIGCYQSLELWNMLEHKTMTLPAHEALIASLAVSTATGLVASASHDQLVKLWK
ncbi:hypothetical protein AALP_AA7G189300 [Arabis alpina]|uniref:Uncharacterized protein n=1 Tax=Arabis alpina TaxID=50452 RepID=A0A087GJ15_ARAAL|nr:hypothetical protein AALP_AA7G189300 [Arabis alpina]